MGTKKQKQQKGERSGSVIFKTYSLGVGTNRDAWVTILTEILLLKTEMDNFYNAQV